jgi:uncharacterized protein with GYD domain
VAAQIREPADRFEAVRPAFEAMGGKIVVGGYPFGEYDMLAVIEAPDDTTAAGFALAVVAGGAVRSASTTRLPTELHVSCSRLRHALVLRGQRRSRGLLTWAG